MAIDQTRVHYYEPENEAQSRQWVEPGSPVFRNAKSVIMLDFQPKIFTTSGVRYANFLDQLRTVIREKRRGKLSKGDLLRQDNARVHICKVAMYAVERNGYKLIPHPACLT